MAKLSTTEVYDKSSIANTNSYKEIETFVDYQIDFATDIVQSYFNGITIKENLKQASFDLTLAHGTTVNIPLTSEYTISGIKSITPIRSYSLSRTTTNTVRLTIYFDKTISIKSDQALWQSSNIVRYRTIPGSIAYLKLGDFIKIANFGTAANNGTFQLIEIDTDNNYLYVLNRSRTSATGDETRTTFAGDTDEKESITITFIA